MRVSFTEHPATVGESYFVHLGRASEFGFRMVAGSLAVAVHAIFPFLLTRTGSRIIASLHDDMIVNRARLSELRRKKAA